jgi:hypothetical protein
MGKSESLHLEFGYSLAITSLLTSAASNITRHMETLVGLTAPLRYLPRRETLPVPATGNRRETRIVGKSPLAVDPPTKRADVSGECQTREITTRFKRAERRGCSLLTLETVGALCRVHDRLMASMLALHSVCSHVTGEMLPAGRCRSHFGRCYKWSGALRPEGPHSVADVGNDGGTGT